MEQEKRLQREAKEKKRTQNRALWSRKKEAMRTIAASVFPKIISFEYDPDTDRLVIKTDEQKLHYNKVLKRNREDIRKEMQNDYEDRGVSRTSYVSNYGRSRRYGYSTDDDINSVDGGPPSEAYDDASDDEGHGSHVAGIIAAEKNNDGMHGVAYNADIYGFKAFNSSGVAPSGATGSAYGLVEAIGAIDIINNSWSSDADCTSASNCRSVIGTTLYDNWEDVSQLATPKISVFSAGNDGESEPNAQCQTMKYNSDISAVSVCVVATSHYTGSSYNTGDGKIASFSNHCGSVSAYCIAAPGDTLYNTGYLSNTHYTTKSGTSMAAPHVSGMLALIKERFSSSLTNKQVRTRLLNGATYSGLKTSSGVSASSLTTSQKEAIFGPLIYFFFKSLN